MDNGERQQRVAELIGQHYELLYRVSFRFTGSVADAEDLTEQTLLTAQLKLHQLRDKTAAKPWLLAILRHHFFRNRNRSTRQSVSIDLLPEPISMVDESAELDTDELQTALNELPEEFRLPLVLYYFHELSYQEIATDLSVPVGTVMSRLSRGKKYLRRQLIVDEKDNRESEPRKKLKPQFANQTP